MNTDTQNTNSISPCNHTSVGIVVWSDGRLLLQQRAKPPYGMACPAGHVEEGEAYEAAARRELQEETGLQATHAMAALRGTFDNPCRRPGGTFHHWQVYELSYTQTNGVLVPNKEEVHMLNWYTQKEVLALAQRTKAYQQGAINDNEWMEHPGLEPIWYTLLEQLQVL